jgi:hypothetical protein
MGEFKDAVSKGRRQASDEMEQERAGQDAKITAEKAAVAAGNKWIKEVLQPVIEAEPFSGALPRGVSVFVDAQRD